MDRPFYYNQTKIRRNKIFDNLRKLMLAILFKNDILFNETI